MTPEGRGRTSGHCCEPVDRCAPFEGVAASGEGGHASVLASVSRAEPGVLGGWDFGFASLLGGRVGLLEGDLGLGEVGGVSGVSPDAGGQSLPRTKELGFAKGGSFPSVVDGSGQDRGNAGRGGTRKSGGGDSSSEGRNFFAIGVNESSFGSFGGRKRKRRRKLWGRVPKRERRERLRQRRS